MNGNLLKKLKIVFQYCIAVAHVKDRIELRVNFKKKYYK
jgi:hypothetical protein